MNRESKAALRHRAQRLLSQREPEERMAFLTYRDEQVREHFRQRLRESVEPPA